MKRRVVGPDGQILGEVEGKDEQEVLSKGIQLHQVKLGTERTSDEGMMFSHATQFHNVVGDIYPRENTAEALSVFAVFCVNAAFALEVYLKLLLKLTSAKSSRIIKGHKLKQRYDSLTDDTKRELEDRFSEHSHARFPNATVPLISAEDTCSQFNNAFVEWRYRYEKPLRRLDAPFDYVVLLLNVLSQYCSDLLNRQSSEQTR